MFSKAEVMKKPWFGALSESQVQFAKKVYGLVALGLMVFSVSAWYAGRNMQIFGPIAKPLWYVSIGFLFIGSLLRGVKPVSGIFLFLIMTLMGLSLGPFLQMILRVQPSVIYLAGGMTALIFCTLTAYVHISGKNFSYLYAFLFPMMMGMFVMGIVSMFMGGFGPVMHQVYCYIIVGILTLYILADTSSVTRSFYKRNDPAGAALALSYDIIVIFLYLIMIFMRRD